MSLDYTVGVYEKAFPEELPLLEMLRLAKESGFDFFELSIDRTEKRIARVFDPAFEREMDDAVRATGFPIYSMGLSAVGTYTLGNPEPQIAARGMDIFRRAICFAEKMGIRIIQIPACDMPKFDPRSEETDRIYLANLRKAVEFASAHAVVLGLENMENDYMDSVEKCMRLVNEIDSPYLQLYSDAGNITNAWRNARSDMLRDMERGKGHYFAFHEKEVQPTRYGGLFYGDGWVDFETLTKKAYKLGIRRFVMEYWYTGNENWKADLVKARRLCDAWLA